MSRFRNFAPHAAADLDDAVSWLLDGPAGPAGAEKLLAAVLEAGELIANRPLAGPNMAGKSTFLKQVALVVLMAQVGSFVPAARARIGVVDKLFSRVGASDDLAAGRSTFMVEMLETAAILNGATERSLVILDEVGRGTSTHDGLAIAQACMEYLHDVVGCRTLFATHFHELADVADALPQAVCMAIDAAAVGRHGDVFTYRIGPGRAGRSHGLKVAALAGLPAPVLARAAELLASHTSADSSDRIPAK